MNTNVIGFGGWWLCRFDFFVFLNFRCRRAWLVVFVYEKRGLEALTPGVGGRRVYCVAEGW